MQNSHDNDVLNAWPWIEFLATWWLQATILLAIGLLTARALRRPAYQSTVFRATLIAVLLCPILAFTVNRMGLAVLTLDLRQRFEPQTASSNSEGSLVDSSVLTLNNSQRFVDRELTLADSSLAKPPHSQSPALTITDQPPTTDHEHRSDAAMSTTSLPTRTNTPFALQRWLMHIWLVIGTWLLGAVAFGMYLLIDLQRARWLVKQSASADELCVHCCHQLAAKFRTLKPTVLINPLLNSPCLIGQWRPMILLPEDTQAAHLQRVFLHELAHLKRADWAWTILSRVACALLWFHPLVWWLHQSHLSVAEDICDDYVIQHDGNREGYLQLLMDIAQQSLPVAMPAALSMVGFRSKLGKRALRILDTTRALSTHVSQRFLVTALAIALVAASSVAMLEIGQSRAAFSQPLSNTAADPTVQLENPSIALNEQTQESLLPATRVVGKVVDAQGAPIAGADIALIARKKSGQFLTDISDVLAVGTTNAQGNFQLATMLATDKTHAEARLIVRAQDAALQTRPVELAFAHQDFGTIELRTQSLLRVKLVDLEGEPAKNIGVEVRCVMPSPQNGTEFGTQYHRFSNAPAAWIGPLTTDNQGLLTVPGLASNQGMALLVQPSDKFAIQGIALNTGWNEKRAVNDATYRDIVKNLKANEVTTIPLAPARIFEGTVRLGKNGPPAANTKVQIWASQQEPVASMMSIEGQTDAQGHYRMIPYPGVRFGVQAYPPDNQPYQISQVKNLKWDNTKPTLVTDFDLPECTLARGQIVDAVSGLPVVDASVQYWPMQTNPNDRENIITGWQGIKRTNAKGEFAIPVLPGEGWLIVQAIDTSYAIQTMPERQLLSGKPGGRRAYAHAFEKLDLAVGQQPKPLRIELQRGHDVELEVTDPDGQPVDGAQVFSRLMLGEDLIAGWRSFRAPHTRRGMVTLKGLKEEGDIPVYILDPKRQLGSTVLINRNTKSAKTKLQACGKATISLCSEEGQRTSGLQVLLTMIVTPGQSLDFRERDSSVLFADEDYLPNVDRTNHLQDRSDESGQLTLSALIPGATYRYFDYEGQPHDFVAKAGETIHLGSLTRKK